MLGWQRLAELRWATACLALGLLCAIPVTAQEVQDLPADEVAADEVAAEDVAPDEAATDEVAAAEVAADVEAAGSADLDEAIRAKTTAKGLPDLTRSIDLLQTALDKGVHPQDVDFAETVLSNALMERATLLVQVISTRSLGSQRLQQIHQLIVSDLRRVLVYENPPANAYFLLGRMMAFPGGDLFEARRALTTFLEFEETPDQQRAEALVLRARVQSNEEKALEDFQQAIELAPENTEYRLARAVFHRSRKKYEEALADVEKLLEQSPDEANALILRGDVYRQMKNYDEALSSFDQATEIAPQALLPYQSRGEIYRDLDEFDQAVSQFNKVLELQPGVPRTLVQRAEAYLRGGYPDKALADVDVVLEKEQGLVAAHRLRAEILASTDRMQEAIAQMQLVVKAVPDDLGLKMQLALYYLIGKQPYRAIDVYGKMLAEDEDNFLALRSRGDTYLNMGKHGLAVADFQAALALEPEDTQLLNNLAWVRATSPEAAVRDGKQAVELAQRACELTEFKQSHILSTLAAAHAESGDFTAAIKWSQQAVEMNDPEHGEQLAKELASYQEGKPWREKQQLPEQEESPPRESPTELEQVEAPGSATDL